MYFIFLQLPLIFIQIDAAATNDEINDIIDQDKFLSLINASGWKATAPINVATKHEFLHQLIHQEVILK